jgi:polyribonucleotide nucleotidyltransferase
MKSFETKVGEKTIHFETRGWTQRANGEAIVRCEDTEVLSTAVMSEQEPEGLGFFPLTVNYEERYYASGKILGSRYIRREGKPSDNATLVSRLIDRAIRPVFPKELRREVQVITTCLSWDQQNDPDILSLLGSSLALCLSDIPWQGPIGVVRIGEEQGKLIINPTYEQREQSSFDIVLAGRKIDGQIVLNMIEAAAQEVEEDLILKAAELALPEIEKLIDFQQKIREQIGKDKLVVSQPKEPKLEKEITRFLGKKIEQILYSKKDLLEKFEEFNQLKEELETFAEENFPGKEGLAKEIFEKQTKKLINEKVVKQEKRIDGRRLDELRRLECEVGVVPRTHGSGFFSRGNTKSLSILTLGGPGEQQLIEGMEITGQKRFLHHYNFPPYSIGEVKPLRAPSRREIGHGMLAEKALLPVIPEFEDFPYTIRIVSELLSSNGSTSMASVCSSSLSLMDAGVPIKRPVAGIAIGLIKQGKQYKLLTDIQGQEDSHGDMDFKVAGSRQGITAIQMDVKIQGIDLKILEQALIRAKKARLEILDLIEKTIPAPRDQLSPYAPKIFKIQIPVDKIGEVIGSKGSTIKKIVEQTGATIDIQETGMIYISSPEEDNAKKAIGLIKNIAREAKVGETFVGSVEKNLDFGSIIKLGPGLKGLIRNSRLERRLRPGQKLKVRIVSIDEMGRINLELENFKHGTRPKKTKRGGNINR